MEKIWLKNYPPGVPAEINPDAYSSIVEIFEQSCRQYSQLPAFYNMGVTLTYAELDRYSRDFAAYLQQARKLKKGDRVAIMLPNLLQYPVAMFGALRAGLIVVNVNPLYTADELVFDLKDSGAETIVVLANFAHTVEKALARLSSVKNVIITYLGDFLPAPKAWLVHLILKYFYKKIPDWNIPAAIYFKQALAQGKNLSFVPPLIVNQDIAFFQYTGGTTGVPKAAMLTHRNMVANIEQAHAWVKAKLENGKEIIITALPLYHIFSLLSNGLLFVKLGGLNILITNPRDIPQMIKEMARFSFTGITGVNTLFNALIKDPHFARLDFSSLKLTLGGGMSIQKVVADQWQAITGDVLLEAYGLTETSPAVAINPCNLTAYNGTVGLPVPSTDICIFDEEEKELPLGQAGELAVKGPQVMRGYWKQERETQHVFTADGWLLTGDIASVDEQGYVRILERKKDMILVSGFNVYPNEIEGILVKIPGVHEAAVIAEPDEHSGEAVKAFIVKDDPNLTAEAIIHYCREHMTPYKIPKHIEFRNELPKSNVGKILRHTLRGGKV